MPVSTVCRMLLKPEFARGEMAQLLSFIERENEFMARFPYPKFAPLNAPSGHGYVIVDEPSHAIHSFNRRFPFATVETAELLVKSSNLSDGDFDALRGMIVGAVEERLFEPVFPAIPFEPIKSFGQLRGRLPGRGLDTPTWRFILKLPGWSINEYPLTRDGLVAMKGIAGELAAIDERAEARWRGLDELMGNGLMTSYEG